LEVGQRHALARRELASSGLLRLGGPLEDRGDFVFAVAAVV
jgi:hypothetical protein